MRILRSSFLTALLSAAAWAGVVVDGSGEATSPTSGDHHFTGLDPMQGSSPMLWWDGRLYTATGHGAEPPNVFYWRQIESGDWFRLEFTPPDGWSLVFCDEIGFPVGQVDGGTWTQ